jgi:hypothetical protein
LITLIQKLECFAVEPNDINDKILIKQQTLGDELDCLYVLFDGEEAYFEFGAEDFGGVLKAEAVQGHHGFYNREVVAQDFASKF